LKYVEISTLHDPLFQISEATTFFASFFKVKRRRRRLYLLDGEKIISARRHGLDIQSVFCVEQSTALNFLWVEYRRYYGLHKYVIGGFEEPEPNAYGGCIRYRGSHQPTLRV